MLRKPIHVRRTWFELDDLNLRVEPGEFVALIGANGSGKSSLLRLMAEGYDQISDEAPPVKVIMERDPVSVAPETPTLEAIDLLRHHKVSCLPVVKHGKLVGIVSERDFMPIAYELLEEKLIGE